MADTGKQDPLKPVLQEAEDELSRRLHEACVAESSGLASKTSDEIREIEDSLLAAAVAARQAVTLRRHIQQRDEKDTARDAKLGEAQREARKLERAAQAKEAAEAAAHPGSAGPSDHDVLATSAVREFRDSTGQQWRAWPVIPGMSRTGKPRHYLGDFQRGWICFESLDSPARRRLPCAPARLAETRDEELERLLREAITAPERKGAHKPH